MRERHEHVLRPHVEFVLAIVRREPRFAKEPAFDVASTEVPQLGRGLDSNAGCIPAGLKLRVPSALVLEGAAAEPRDAATEALRALRAQVRELWALRHAGRMAVR